MAIPIQACRICGNRNLEPVLSLGEQALTGVFPRKCGEDVPRGPIELVRCSEKDGMKACGLLQLVHHYPLELLYGESYGYRSGLNAATERHLESVVQYIEKQILLSAGDLILDIGSNDGTLLSKYPEGKCRLVGIDPTGEKFRKYYPSHLELVPDFFSFQAVRQHVGERKARVITSIAMFYDLEAPLDFVNQVSECLADDGIWVIEQSYMPRMLEILAYDTVCHEHLEYYGLRQVDWIMRRAGFRILDVEFNAINGGSFRVTLAKKDAPFPSQEKKIEAILEEEIEKGLHREAPYTEFSKRVEKHREAFILKIREIRGRGETIFGYGASTKGNVLLQYCDLTPDEIKCIAEINEDKFGCYTPGTSIPIVPEKEAREKKPDYFLVLPWHFREGIVKREKAFLKTGGKLLFPLPEIEEISGLEEVE